MKHMKILFTGLVALTLHNSGWAEQIYETTNAEGNAVFTDSPKLENAKQIELQQTNIADAPQQQPQEEQEQQQMAQPQDVAPEQAPMQENSPVIVNDNNATEELEQGELRRERALEAADPQAPHEVGDSMDQMPDEVGDFDAPPEVENIDGGEPQYIEGAPEAERRANEVRRRAQ